MHKILTLALLLSLGASAICKAEETATDSEIQQQIEDLQRLHINSGPEFRLVGKVTTVSGHYAINGEEFSLHDEAVIEGDFHSGVFAEVSGPLEQGELKKADHVVVASTDTTVTDSTTSEGPPAAGGVLN